MISPENKPLNTKGRDSDFTIEQYGELLRLAKSSFTFTTYTTIPWGERFILWRHDCDFSLNRALALARIEAGADIIATYFLNPHCEFYNIFEASQWQIVKEILELGHKIGLHFDVAFHGIKSVEELDKRIRSEAALLKGLFGVEPIAFSFHNPVAADLSYEAEEYGGLNNCYSRRFKTEVPYCSDSNGYWRFRRLYDVLTDATDPCLQVLTHPGWWQEKAISPWQRVKRSIEGRAKNTKRYYKQQLEKSARLNIR